MSPSLVLVVVGSFMVPGGVLAPGSDAVVIAVIVAGSLMAIAGAAVGWLPVQWTAISFGPLSGVIDTDDADFERFYCDQHESLQRFTFLLCGDGARASELLREAAARTREQWRAGASADPRTATVHTLLRLQEHSGLLQLFVTAGAGRPGGKDSKPIEGQLPRATLDALSQLSFPARAALTLHVVYTMGTERMAELLERSEDTVRTDLASALQHVETVLPA